MSRALVLAGSGALVLAAALLPWYALGEYESNGWDGSRLIAAAVLAAIANVIVVRSGGPPRVVLGLALLALALVAARVAWPPDFGFGFDGLDVPVERRFGCWVGLGAAALAVLGAFRQLPTATRLLPRPRSAATE